jgi:hypothetical protein
MFIGHYAPAFAAKAVRKSPGLWVCFAAVQLVDIGFFLLAYLGIEKWRPNPTITGITPVDLYYMPFTHSLLGSAVWALAAGLLALLLAPAGRKAVAGGLVSALVFSHWLLDLLVHRPDLGILDNEPDKLGFGLWDHPRIEMPLEIGLVLVGFCVYLSSTRARGAWGCWMPWIVLALLLVLQSINWFGAAPQSTAALSGLGLFAYGLCVALAWLLDRTRTAASDP